MYLGLYLCCIIITIIVIVIVVVVVVIVMIVVVHLTTHDLLTCLTHVSLVVRLPRDMHLCRSSSNVSRLPTLLKPLQNLNVFFFLNHF